MTSKCLSPITGSENMKNGNFLLSFVWELPSGGTRGFIIS